MRTRTTDYTESDSTPNNPASSDLIPLEETAVTSKETKSPDIMSEERHGRWSDAAMSNFGHAQLIVQECKVKNFMVVSGCPVVISGTVQAVQDFKAFVQAGYVLKFSYEGGETGILQAINITLSAMHAEDNRYVHTVESMASLLASESVYKSLSIPSDTQQMSTAFASHPVLPLIPQLLHKMGQELNAVYKLGHVRFDPGLQKYLVETIEPSVGSSAAQTVWIHNENAFGQPSRDHWSGFTKFEVIPGTAATQQVTPVLSDVENSSIYDPSSAKPDLPGTNDESRARVRKATKKTYLYRDMIRHAPTQDTNLPWRSMAGISSHELLTFFPNHSLHWPAICARLMEEGWTFSRIADYINRVRKATNQTTYGIAVHTEDSSATPIVLSNTIGLSITKGCGSFYDNEDWAYREFSRQVSSRNETEWMEVEEKIRQTRWAPYHNDRCQQPAITSAWSLEQLGQSFIDAYGPFPCSGSFTTQVRAAMMGLDDQTNRQYSQTPAMIEDCNPPALPVDWKPCAAREWKSDFENNIRSQGASAPPLVRQPSTQSSSMFSLSMTSKDRRLTRDQMPPEVRNDARAIIQHYPETLAGEVLLWSLSKHGGRMGVREVYEELQGRFNTEFSRNPQAFRRGQKAPTRSTISKRKEAALRERANSRGTSYHIESHNFEKTEAYQLKSEGKKVMAHSDSDSMEEDDSLAPHSTETGNQIDMDDIGDDDVHEGIGRDKNSSQELYHQNGDEDETPMVDTRPKALSRSSRHIQSLSTSKSRGDSTIDPRLLAPDSWYCAAQPLLPNEVQGRQSPNLAFDDYDLRDILDDTYQSYNVEHTGFPSGDGFSMDISPEHSRNPGNATRLQPADLDHAEPDNFDQRAERKVNVFHQGPIVRPAHGMVRTVNASGPNDESVDLPSSCLGRHADEVECSDVNMQDI